MSKRTSSHTVVYRSAKTKENPVLPEVLEALHSRRRERRMAPKKKSIGGLIIGKTFLFALIAGAGIGLVYILNSIN